MLVDWNSNKGNGAIFEELRLLFYVQIKASGKANRSD